MNLLPMFSGEKPAIDSVHRKNIEIDTFFESSTFTAETNVNFLKNYFSVQHKCMALAA